AVLSGVSTRCKALEECFQKCVQVERKPISSPEDVEALFSELLEIQNTFASSLNTAQAALLNSSKETVDKRANEKRLKAEEWLADKEKQAITTENLEGLLAQLETPMAFLAEEQQDKLAAIRSAVQQRITERDDARKRREQDAPIVATVQAMLA